MCNFYLKPFLYAPQQIIMKKIFPVLLACISVMFILSGCLETTQEITVNADGTGSISTTNDMSALLGMAKQMGAGKEIEDAGQQQIDSTFSLAPAVDSIESLSDTEKSMLKKGTAHVIMNLKENKLTTNLLFPFKSVSEIPACNKLSEKIMAEKMKGQMEGMPGGESIPSPSSLDNYYTFEFSNGEFKKKLNKEKFATAEDDEFLKGMKEAGGMGLVMKANYIINLPRPAKEAEGKGIKLSDDKKKITITVGIDDFFEDPSLLEFKIKY